MRKKLPIFYSALMLTGVNLLLRLVGTSFQVYLSGRIGAEGIGLLQLVMSVGLLAMTAGMAGIRTATMYLTAEELGKKRPGNVIWVLSACMGYSVLCSGTISLALYFGAPYLAEHWIGNLSTLGAIRLYSAFLPISCLCGVMTGYFTGANRIGTLAAVEVAEQLLSMASTMLLLSLWAGTSASRACMCVILGSGLGACITLVLLVILRHRERVSAAPKISVRKRLLHAAVPLALADDVKSGISTVENLMVPKRLALYPGTENPLAAFGTITGMVFPVMMFPAAILFGLAELLIPELARCAAAGSTQRIRYLTHRSLHVALIYGCVFSGLLLLLADPLCTKLYHSTEAVKYMQRFAVLVPILYCDAITDAITKGLGQQKICVRYNILTSFMDIAFLFILLPRYGMTGYFWSFLITHLLNFVLSLRLLCKITGIKLRIAVPLLSFVSTVFAVWSSSYLQQIFPKTVAFLTILMCLLFLFRVLGKEELAWLKGLVYKK